MRYGTDQRILSYVAPLSHARILSASFLEDTEETTADGGMGTPVWSTTQARGGSLVCYLSPFSQRLLRSVSNMTRLRSRPLDDTGFIPIAPLRIPRGGASFSLLLSLVPRLVSPSYFSFTFAAVPIRVPGKSVHVSHVHHTRGNICYWFFYSTCDKASRWSISEIIFAIITNY